MGQTQNTNFVIEDNTEYTYIYIFYKIKKKKMEQQYPFHSEALIT